MESLREKGDRLTRDLEKKATKKILKKPQTTIVPDHIKKIEDNLLALKIFGDIKLEIPLEIPTDETKLSELELVFDNNYRSIKDLNYQKEAKSLLDRYERELKKLKITTLQEKLESLDEDNPLYEDILAELNKLLKN